MKLIQRIKKKWQKWLQDMAKANEKQFGHQTPSCCGQDKKSKIIHIGNYSSQ